MELFYALPHELYNSGGEASDLDPTDGDCVAVVQRSDAQELAINVALATKALDAVAEHSETLTAAQEYARQALLVIHAPAPASAYRRPQQ